MEANQKKEPEKKRFKTSRLNKVEEAWRDEARAVRINAGVSLDCKPWTQRPGVRLRGITPTERNLEMIDIQYICQNDRLKNSAPADAEEFWMPNQQIVKGLACDQSQNPNVLKKSSGKFQGHGCNSEWYFFPRDSVIFPVESFFGFGYDKSDIHDSEVTEEELQDLIGEAVTAPCLSKFMMCTILSAEIPGLWAARPTTSRV